MCSCFAAAAAVLLTAAAAADWIDAIVESVEVRSLLNPAISWRTAPRPGLSLAR